MSVHVFVGPTLAAARVLDIVPDATLHPPAAHGDLLRLPRTPGTAVVLIDGFFHQRPAVRHKEILALLADGVPVVGCSSIGALRAAELHTFGMVGHGVVFDLYRSGSVESDDEVAVTHTEAPDYRRLSEPAVTFRVLLGRASAAGVLDRATADRIMTVVRDQPYPSRTWRSLENAVRSGMPELVPAWTRLVDFSQRHPHWSDVKASDAVDTLHRLEALLSDGLGDRPWMATSDWRSVHLAEWCVQFTGRRVDGIEVGDGDVLRYRQLYDDGFPDIWRRFVLSAVAGIDPTAADEATLSGSALAGAARQGLTLSAVTPELAAYWLTSDELARVSRDQVVELILIRSYDDAWTRPRLVALPHVLDDDRAVRAVAECKATNDVVAARDPARSVAHLKHERLASRLVRDWGLIETDGSRLRSAARDRGFGTFSEAVEATRPFFLRRHLLGRPGAAIARPSPPVCL